MTPSLSPSLPRTAGECRLAGETFGREMRGRPRTKFETALVKQLAVLELQAAEAALDPEEALAAFDTAAWEAWEAAVSSLPASETGPGESGRGGRGRIAL